MVGELQLMMMLPDQNDDEALAHHPHWMYQTRELSTKPDLLGRGD